MFDLLELELQAAVISHGVPGLELGSTGRVFSVPNYQAISPALQFLNSLLTNTFKVAIRMIHILVLQNGIRERFSNSSSLSGGGRV